MKKLVCLLAVMVISGCVTLPGTIKESVSGFDKATEITLEPAGVGNGLAGLRLGLFRSSKMEPEKAILTACAMGTYNFQDGESLLFNIDGQVTSLTSMDAFTKIETVPGSYSSVYSSPAYNVSSKRYEVTKDFIKKLLDGKEVWGKLMLDQTYMEAKFSDAIPMGAKNGFKKFYDKVWGTAKEKR